ncbi:hypothetical protein [Pedobacter sp. GR22-10]|uniref:hypothetical protein n=1 Tax=Pedobacter sp. GR22-10 TaxID=2994472 RepID=UPI0022472EE2|nr:hypothetical protein [Pedobacter sp. GR22-10]MCX2429932.1 hypothetical protein [Pedobacter sp. GR22-10]
MGKPSNEHINESMNDFVSDKGNVPTASDAKSILGAIDSTVYLSFDQYSGNPDALLGNVFQYRISEDGKDHVLENCPTKVLNTPIDANSHLKEPIKRQSVIVDQKLSLEVGFLNYLSAEMDAQSTFSLIVFDQATGLVDRTAVWDEGLRNWKNNNEDLFQDQSIENIFVVIGYVQKYVIRKKFKKFDVKAKGGTMGLNVSGELYMSSEDYSLDIRYGLTVATLKRPGANRGLGMAPRRLENSPTAEEISSIQKFKTIEEYKN